jgi:fibronectin type 3 domain-containing protein
MLFTAGCGYIGEPMPPLANVPAAIRDLAAIQRGDRIIVQFTVPQHTTEGRAIRPRLELDLRIGTAATPFDAARWAEHATRAQGAEIDGGIARYEIPVASWIGKEAVVGARAIGANGKDSGWSNYVTMPLVAPPEKPSHVQGSTTVAGVRLTWVAQGARFRVLRRRGDREPFATVGEVPQAEWMDADIEYGKPYTYLVQTVVDLGDRREAQSELSEPFTITPVDTFPPAVPTGLSVTPAPNSIELSWERNTEPDLAGYRVYRAMGDGEFEKLAEVNAVPSYSDRDVQAGRNYRYAVSAVDKAGNEGERAASAAVTMQ